MTIFYIKQLPHKTVDFKFSNEISRTPKKPERSLIADMNLLT